MAGADFDSRRLLIRDRSYLLTRTVGDRVKGEIEYVVGLGPEKTLQRGFVVARHSDGRPVTLKADLAAKEIIALTFADGQVGAQVK